MYIESCELFFPFLPGSFQDYTIYRIAIFFIIMLFVWIIKKIIHWFFIYLYIIFWRLRGHILSKRKFFFESRNTFNKQMWVMEKRQLLSPFNSKHLLWLPACHAFFCIPVIKAYDMGEGHPIRHCNKKYCSTIISLLMACLYTLFTSLRISSSLKACQMATMIQFSPYTQLPFVWFKEKRILYCF